MIETHLFPAIQDISPFQIANIHAFMDRVVKGNPYAKAALDIAIYDLAGKALNRPVCELLGGDFRNSIEVAHSLGIMPIDQCIEEAKQAVEEGVTTIKCKTALDPERDLEIVRRLRKEVCESFNMILDAYEAYQSVSEAVSVTRAQQDYGIYCWISPVSYTHLRAHET